jgi:hypothetical protein
MDPFENKWQQANGSWFTPPGWKQTCGQVSVPYNTTRLRPCLFNLATDLNETTDLASALPKARLGLLFFFCFFAPCDRGPTATVSKTASMDRARLNALSFFNLSSKETPQNKKKKSTRQNIAGTEGAHDHAIRLPTMRKRFKGA